MTGKDLIIFILENNLENKPIIENGRFIGLMSVGEAASKLDVGVETIKAWVKLGWLDGVMIGDELFLLPSLSLKSNKE